MLTETLTIERIRPQPDRAELSVIGLSESFRTI